MMSIVIALYILWSAVMVAKDHRRFDGPTLPSEIDDQIADIVKSI